MDSNQRRSEQLGMPHGTANNKLRKYLLYKYVQLANHDICYRCSQKIESVDEFSIEHKMPWLDVSVDLYWDLNNIAFSHYNCNVRAARRDTERCKKAAIKRGLGRRKSSTESTAWCRGCNEEIDRSKFSIDRKEINGLYSVCRDCRKNLPSRLGRESQ